MVALGGVAVAVGAQMAMFGGAARLATLMAGQQAAAIGILAFNLEAMVFGPMYFVNMEPIEWKNE